MLMESTILFQVGQLNIVGNVPKKYTSKRFTKI